MILENKLGIIDQVELAKAEEKISKQKAKQLFGFLFTDFFFSFGQLHLVSDAQFVFQNHCFSPSISKTMASISVRSWVMRATVVFSSALSSLMLITSRVSSAST